MPGASRVEFATVVKAWSAPTTWPAAVVTTRRKCTVVPGFSLRSLAVTGCGPVTAASGWTAVQRRPAVASPSSNATWPATAARVDGREERGRGLRDRRCCSARDTRRPPAAVPGAPDPGRPEEACRSRRQPPTRPRARSLRAARSRGAQRSLSSEWQVSWLWSDGGPVSKTSRVCSDLLPTSRHLHTSYLSALHDSQPTHRFGCFAGWVTEFSRKEHR